MKDIAKMKKEEILKNLEEKRKELHNVRFAFAGSTGKNVKASRELRKDIARLLTELKSRTLIA